MAQERQKGEAGERGGGVAEGGVKGGIGKEGEEEEQQQEWQVVNAGKTELKTRPH